MRNARIRLPDYFRPHADKLRSLSPGRLANVLAGQENSYRLLVMSDLHGPLLDPEAFSCVLRYIAAQPPDEIVLNGDILDFPYISTHRKRLDENHPLLSNYSEIQEIKDATEQIFKPLRQAAPEAKIVYRLGNHEERFIKPNMGGDIAERILSCQMHFQTTKLEEMLGLPALAIEYDPTPSREYYGIFHIVHGLSLAKNAPEKNINEYFGSGTTGHTHRLGSQYRHTKRGSVCWVESGCLCRLKASYIPTGKITNWAQGFVTVSFHLEEKPWFSAKTHGIINGRCEVGGIIY